MTKNVLFFLFVIFIGVAGYYVIHLGHYPVAIVNGSIITAKALNDEYGVALEYYAKTLAGQKDFDPTSTPVQKELRRAALNDLIDKSLIEAELKKRTGNNFDAAVDERIASVNADTKTIADAAKNLYGLDLAGFRALVLVPQAEKELLEGRLFLEQKKLDDWLSQAEQTAKVTILTPELSWSTNKVVSQ